MLFERLCQCLYVASKGHATVNGSFLDLSTLRSYDDIKDMINDLDERAPCGFQVVSSWLLHGLGALDPVPYEMMDI